VGQQDGHPRLRFRSGGGTPADRKPVSTFLRIAFPRRLAGGGGLVSVCPQEKFATDIFILDGMEREFSEDGRGRPPTGPAPTPLSAPRGSWG